MRKIFFLKGGGGGGDLALILLGSAPCPSFVQSACSDSMYAKSMIFLSQFPHLDCAEPDRSS